MAAIQIDDDLFVEVEETLTHDGMGGRHDELSSRAGGEWLKSNSKDQHLAITLAIAVSALPLRCVTRASNIGLGTMFRVQLIIRFDIKGPWFLSRPPRADDAYLYQEAVRGLS